MNKKIILFLAIGCTSLSLFAQPFPSGAVIDDDLYESIPQKAVQLSRAYDSPSSYSLKQYAPYANLQKGGTCTAWASAYAARTIAESKTLNKLERLLITQNVFSPYHLYKSVFIYDFKDPEMHNYNNPNPLGKEGIPIKHAMEFLKREGAVRTIKNEFNLEISQIKLSMYSGYRRYPIASYAKLYDSRRKLKEGDSIRTTRVKKAISEGKPVVIAMKYPKSFENALYKDVWRPTEDSNTINNILNNEGGHAVCVVGYDDNEHEGAFEILNSWGTNWGKAGFIWIPYTVFNKFAVEAYEMIENMANYEILEFSGSVHIQLYNSNQSMPVRFNGEYYQTINSYPSGTEFQYILNNGKEAWVYAFGGDSGSNVTTHIFPPEGISPVLNYKGNAVAFPDEYTWIKLDERVGTDYLVVLYAKEALDINNIRRRFERASGTFPARVVTAVGSNFIPVKEAQYASGEMRFSAKSKNPKAVFVLLLAIDHRAR
ncbi:C1 family peptidase [Treponema sp. R80B11-R83G3]